MTSQKKSITFFLLIAVVCPVVVFAMVHWYENTMQDLPYFGKNYTVSTGKNDRFQIEDFSFENESGTISNLDSIKGKV